MLLLLVVGFVFGFGVFFVEENVTYRSKFKSFGVAFLVFTVK